MTLPLTLRRVRRDRRPARKPATKKKGLLRYVV